MGLISDSAHSDAWRKKAVTGDWRYFVILRSKLDLYQDGLLYVRVISSSHNFFFFFVRGLPQNKKYSLLFLLQLLVCLLFCFLLNYYYYALHEMTWCMVVWWTQNAPRWQQFHVAPAMPALYTTLVDIQKRALKSYSLMSNHMRAQWVCSRAETSAI